MSEWYYAHNDRNYASVSELEWTQVAEMIMEMFMEGSGLSVGYGLYRKEDGEIRR